MTFILNGKYLTDKAAAHPYLARMLALPDYYGGSLDALYDCLTDMGPRAIVLLGADALEADGGYGAKVLQTVQDAALANTGLRLELKGARPW